MVDVISNPALFIFPQSSELKNFSIETTIKSVENDIATIL